MDPVRNPFMPGAGAPPPELAGRQAPLSQADLLFQEARLGRVPKSFIAAGLRGIGKTVLLHRVGQVARDHGWRPCGIEADLGPGTHRSGDIAFAMPLFEPFLGRIQRSKSRAPASSSPISSP